MAKQARWFWAIWTLGTICLLAMAVWFHEHPGPLQWELKVDRWIQERPLDFLSSIGNALGYSRIVVANLIVVTAIFLVIRRKWWALFVLSAMIGWLFNQALKQVVERPRPTPEYVRVTEHPDSWSFASGHTVAGSLFFGALAMLAWRTVASGRWRGAIVAIAVVLSGLIGVSRVYVGAHWPTDALGGWLIAALFLALLARIATWATERYGLLDQKDPPPGG